MKTRKNKAKRRAILPGASLYLKERGDLCPERLGQIADQVVYVLGADGQADGVGLIPDSSSSCPLIWEWVVLAGWMTRDFTSATFASREKISSRSIKALASSAPPLISKVKIEPAPRGNISYRGRYRGCPTGRDG
jgi:hypothetical protein